MKPATILIYGAVWMLIAGIVQPSFGAGGCVLMVMAFALKNHRDRP